MKDLLATCALAMVATLRFACAGGDISFSWDEAIELGPGGYARVHRLSDGRLMAAYERGGDLMVRFCARDCVDRWTEPQCVARGFAVTNASDAVRVNLVNAEFAQLATGRILLACNMRPSGKNVNVHPYAIAIAASDDAGVSWSPLKIVYKGSASADGVSRGCYEPFILPLSGGAAQMFYADETPYVEGRVKYQEISVVETGDGGETWSVPRTVSYAPKRRDGMPAVLQMGEWRYLAIESNPGRTRLHPQIIRSRVADNWREMVGEPSQDRFEPFLEPRNWKERYGGAPYIAATENFILLSWQETADRGDFATFRTVACVAAMPKAEVKDGRITAMRGVSTPPRHGDAKMRWNALCPLGGDRFLLVSDVEGRIVLWPGRVDDSPAPVAGLPPEAWHVPKVKVALYLDIGCKGGGVIHLAELLKSSAEVSCDFLNAADVQAGKLAGYDVLVMPGGGGLERYGQLGEEGFEKIRKYIREGGCYYGICAGIAMALNDPKRLRLIPYTREKNPPRGGFSAAVTLNRRAEELLGVPAGTRYFRYHDGPLPAKGDPVPDSEYEVLATFDSHVMQRGKSVTPMYGMPAIIYGRYGNGKVLVTVMHPEYFPSTHDVLAGGFKALVGRLVTFAYRKKSARPLRVACYAGEIDRTGDTRATVEDVLALAARPDVDVTYVSGEQIAEGALEHADALLLPGGRSERMWRAARPLVDKFKADGNQIATSGKDLTICTKNEGQQK